MGVFLQEKKDPLGDSLAFYQDDHHYHRLHQEDPLLVADHQRTLLVDGRAHQEEEEDHQEEEDRHQDHHMDSTEGVYFLPVPCTQVSA